MGPYALFLIASSLLSTQKRKIEREIVKDELQFEVFKGKFSNAVSRLTAAMSPIDMNLLVDNYQVILLNQFNSVHWLSFHSRFPSTGHLCQRMTQQN